MMRTLLRQERGAGAMEFALAAPVLFTIMIGATQVGTMFFANAGVRNAVAEGARVASIFPLPSDDEIRAAITSQDFGLKSGQVVGEPEIEHGVDDNGNTVVDISLRYQVPLDFVFFDAGPVTISHSRTVFVQTGTEFTGAGDGSGSDGGSGGGDDGGDDGGTTPTPDPDPQPEPEPEPECTKKNGKCK